MNPKILLESEKNIFNETKKYLDIFKDVPYIFNLGHGIVPETNPDKALIVINTIKAIGRKKEEFEACSTNPSSVIFFIKARNPVFVNAKITNEKILMNSIHLYFKA